FSPNGTRLALASWQSVCLFDARKGRLVAQWQPHEKHQVWALSYAPDGRTLATGAKERVVKLWDVRGLSVEGPALRAAYDWGLGYVRAVAFAPDGMTAAAVGDNRRVVVWVVDGT